MRTRNPKKPMDYAAILPQDSARGIARAICREALTPREGQNGPALLVLAALRLRPLGRRALRDALTDYLTAYAERNGGDIGAMLLEPDPAHAGRVRPVKKARDEINAAAGIKSERRQRKQDRRAALFNAPAAPAPAAPHAAAGAGDLRQALSKTAEGAAA